MTVTVFFSVFFYFLFLTYLSFFLVKRGKKLSNRLLIIIGSLFMYPIVNSSLRFIYFNIKEPFFHFKNKAQLLKIEISLFKNLYNFRLFNFIECILFISISLWLGNIIVTKYWDKDLRIKFLTWGLCSIIIGSFIIDLLGKFYTEFIN